MEDKGGRPKKVIDKKLFEGLCRIQCTKNEICGFLECDEKTLTRWCKETYEMGFSDIYKNFMDSGKVSLRRAQFRSAESGNPSMLIWLGKQYLGQVDKQEIDLGSKDDKPLRAKVDLKMFTTEELREIEHIKRIAESRLGGVPTGTGEEKST